MAGMDVGRRRFLALAGGGAAALTGAATVGAAPSSGWDDPWQAAFTDARARQPWLAGYDSAPLAGHGPLTLPLPKAWPTSLTGTLYRNGPALHSFGGTRYRHWFDGDGMVQRYHIADGHLTFSSRYVRTAKLTQEIAAGRRLWPTFGSAVSGPDVTHPDALNPANISVLWHNQRLFALWEAGSPHEVDPATLATRGRVAWDGESYLPFTAHPKIDATGALWGIGYANVGPNRLILYHLDRRGRPRQRRILAVPQMPPVHDFILTEDYMVIPLAPFAFESGDRTAAYLDQHRWDGGRPTRILIVNRADFTQVRVVEGAPWWAFHYAGGWQESDGTIHLVAVTYPDTDILTGQLRA
ncbi:MAG: carotenoid oxygenase family protein, partial [Thalassobaculaceae bacterium]